jgi:subtilase family serine protease
MKSSWLRLFAKRLLRPVLHTHQLSKKPHSSLRFEALESRDVPSAVFTPDYVVFKPTNNASPLGTTGPTGYTPTEIRNAYGFSQISFNGTTGNGTGTTIAIVDAYSDPTITSDLHAFDQEFGLADPTLSIVNQGGGTTLPAANTGWAGEISLDVEWAHAIAPGAKILLVEATNSSESNLFTAVKYAAAQKGVAAVSMSWGGSEFSGETSDDSVFTPPASNPDVVFINSSGDSGAPAEYPSTSPNVLSVGGTTLNLSSTGSYLSESAWSGSGGGISTVESQPSYQKGIVTQSTTKRTDPDVSYDANPNTGFPVYQT